MTKAKTMITWLFVGILIQLTPSTYCHANAPIERPIFAINIKKSKFKAPIIANYRNNDMLSDTIPSTINKDMVHYFDFAADFAVQVPLFAVQVPLLFLITIMAMKMATKRRGILFILVIIYLSIQSIPGVSAAFGGGFSHDGDMALYQPLPLLTSSSFFSKKTTREAKQFTDFKRDMIDLTISVFKKGGHLEGEVSASDYESGILRLCLECEKLEGMTDIALFAPCLAVKIYTLYMPMCKLAVHYFRNEDVADWNSDYFSDYTQYKEGAAEPLVSSHYYLHQLKQATRLPPGPSTLAVPRGAHTEGGSMASAAGAAGAAGAAESILLYKGISIGRLGMAPGEFFYKEGQRVAHGPSSTSFNYHVAESFAYGGVGRRTKPGFIVVYKVPIRISESEEFQGVGYHFGLINARETEFSADAVRGQDEYILWDAQASWATVLECKDLAADGTGPCAKAKAALEKRRKTDVDTGKEFEDFEKDAAKKPAAVDGKKRKGSLGFVEGKSGDDKIHKKRELARQEFARQEYSDMFVGEEVQKEFAAEEAYYNAFADYEFDVAKEKRELARLKREKINVFRLKKALMTPKKSHYYKHKNQKQKYY